MSDMCDVVTGECECSEGVGGSDCSYCIDGYFNYTSIGCTCKIFTLNLVYSEISLSGHLCTM